MNKLPARTGWLWLKAGFGLLRAQPGLLMLLMFSNFLASIAISMLPLIGPLVAALLFPALSMAVLQASADIDAGKRADLGLLATGFRMPGFKALCKLGLVYMLLVAIVLLLMQAFIDPAAFRQVPTAGGPPKLVLSPADMLPLMGILTLQSAALILMSFAAPLTLWQKMPPFKATFYSVFGVLGAKGAFAVMLATWFGLLMAISFTCMQIFGSSTASGVLFVWIMLLFSLLLQCAIYAAYRQIFGAPEPVAAKR